MATELFPIDFVVTWVDGNDPEHRRKRLIYATGSESLHNDVGGETRYRSVGEIAFCIGSILRFAPFVRKIFIVTDQQNPHLEAFVAHNFPDNSTPIEIVDHTVIFRGYEHYLPTFNSVAIETMLWRIPGLSEHYVYMNDDFSIISPVGREDFFDKSGIPVTYSYWHSTVTARLMRFLRRRKDGHKKLRFRDTMLNAADVLGSNRFLRINHTPQMMLRSFFEKFYQEHPEVMENNIRHRFRSASRVNVHCLQSTALALSGKCRIEPSPHKYIYIQPRPDGTLVEKQIQQMEKAGALFCCLNSLDFASEESRRQILEAITSRIGIEIV